jgi:ATP phosphoribosyltransferase regulatory subunit
MNHAWLLPEYIEDILPPYARQAEELRRKWLDLFDTWGYEVVCPPLTEYLDSLLTGTARDLDLKTFKVVDGLSGRMLGIRADMTPQAARIDAHLLNRQGVTRLCYAGPALHTRPAALTHSREIFQVGAELFGYAGVEADLEVLRLLLAALGLAGLPEVRISLGHAGLFLTLVKAAGLSEARRLELFGALQGKDIPTLDALTADLPKQWSLAFRRLPDLYGGAEALDAARRDLPALPGIAKALDELAVLLAAGEGAQLTLDLADLRGYGYHNGAVVAAYVGGQAQAVALGGRYDGAGAIFGRSRPATGFSLDLRCIDDCMSRPDLKPGILAPTLADPALQARIDELRHAGERVVSELPGQEAHRAESGCDRTLRFEQGEWRVYLLA